MSVIEEVSAANESYASGFAKGGLPMPPGREFAVVTCMDARLDPARFLGLEEGDAHLIRNAGGLVNDETIRSLVISHHLLGTKEAVVIGHTDCGMLTFTNEDLQGRLGPESESIDFQPFPDVAQRVRQSVETIRSHPLLPESFEATGFVYDPRGGRLRLRRPERPDRARLAREASFEADLGDTRKRLRDRAVLLRRLGSGPEPFLVESRHTPVDRERDVRDALTGLEGDGRGGVELLRRSVGSREAARKRHREARGMGRRDQLLGARQTSVLVLG